MFLNKCSYLHVLSVIPQSGVKVLLPLMPLGKQPLMGPLEWILFP